MLSWMGWYGGLLLILSGNLDEDREGRDRTDVLFASSVISSANLSRNLTDSASSEYLVIRGALWFGAQRTKNNEYKSRGNSYYALGVCVHPWKSWVIWWISCVVLINNRGPSENAPSNWPIHQSLGNLLSKLRNLSAAAVMLSGRNIFRPITIRQLELELPSVISRINSSSFKGSCFWW